MGSAGKNESGGGGTGTKLGTAVVIVCGVASLVASLLSLLSIWLQTKNYRKPLLQRYVVRILLMVPIYSASSWGSIMSLKAAFYLDPLRDIYEAFTIYTFFQLLINFLGGERSLIIMMHGRQPVNHAWPLNHCFNKVDISDPHTFLAIKRGILQYAWLKPILSLATIIMKATNTYHEGYLGVSSGYLWLGILYNVSVTLSLYSLAMFWVCMSVDLQPFRPVPKFLCVKLIIFASYWQGFFLSILQALGAIPNVEGYTSDNLAAAIQDALICCEMPIFAVAHWYAFSWHDYADVTISSARMPVKYACRDAFGIRDLIEDTKETFGGKKYGYRAFDSGDNILAHEESDSRVRRMMEGMRYERGGKGKYWIPKPGEVNAKTPLLGKTPTVDRRDRTPTRTHGTLDDERGSDSIEPLEIDNEDERLFASARALEFGDWNYPVVTAHIPSHERWIRSDPNMITTSANRNLLKPKKVRKRRKNSGLPPDSKHERKTSKDKGKARESSSDRNDSSSNSRYRAPVLEPLLRKDSSHSSASAKSGRSQLVDLVVEDKEAEEVERVRARKEGGAAWNANAPKHFLRTYGDEDHGEMLRSGFEPDHVRPDDEQFAIGEDDEETAKDGPSTPSYGNLNDKDVWS